MKLSLTEFAVKLVTVFYWMSNCVHEYSHLLALRLLGHMGTISSDALNKVTPIFMHPVTPSERLIIYGAGGVGVFLTYMVLAWRNQEPENRTCYIFVAITNIIYAFFEALYPSSLWETGALIGVVSALTYFMYLLLIKQTEITL